MNTRKDQDLPTRLRQEAEQITGEFAGIAAPEIVERCVVVARQRIAEARVPDYVPIFFGRHARRLIREAAGVSAIRAR